MKKKIFYAIFLGIFSVQILSMLSIIFMLDNVIKNLAFSRLNHALSELTSQDIANILLHKDSIIPLTYRLSLISTQGEVLYDSQADINKLDNHLSRQEVQTLLKDFNKSKSESVRVQRESSTLNEQTLYVANMTIIESTPIIARLSEQKRAIGVLLVDLLPYLCALLFFGFILSIVLALILSKKIITPIQNIDLSHPVRTNPYPELQVFMERIAKQKKKIKKQVALIQARQRENEVIIQSMHGGFLLINNQTQIRSCNHTALEYLHITAQDSLFKIPHLKPLINELERISKEPAEQANEQDYSFECEIQERNLYFIALPAWVKNQLQAIALIIFDKTTQKQAQDFRKEFSANVTHELKTPLSIILASSEMLKSGLVKTEDRAEFVNKIYTESQRLLTLIDKILRLSFFDENSLELEKTPLDLLEILRRVSKNVAPLALEKHIKIVISPQTREGKIWGISSLIEDMVYNLIENAIKYSHDNSTITLSITHSGQNIIMSVKDEGIGIPKNEQERVFERFYCVDKSHSKKLGGSGLGLSIVKHIAKIHNAKIRLVSQVGIGTTISVEFRG
ncbi:two-component sensor histidine kinase [Helicobacter jaachi]|uniref:histidine kinase n=1 Tax=Helicobacter jaachi TaxID=1677920 RepID=A0A4V6I2U0_9HELI|nr:ATP-binding protein [Helicobacter jaachi]TLD97422.1 two-component sensor histidine kinase [Helicobacter jaachi]